MNAHHMSAGNSCVKFFQGANNGVTCVLGHDGAITTIGFNKKYVFEHDLMQMFFRFDKNRLIHYPGNLGLVEVVDRAVGFCVKNQIDGMLDIRTPEGFG